VVNNYDPRRVRSAIEALAAAARSLGVTAEQAHQGAVRFSESLRSPVLVRNQAELDELMGQGWGGFPQSGPPYIAVKLKGG
jgi:hypothetical protein